MILPIIESEEEQSSFFEEKEEDLTLNFIIGRIKKEFLDQDIEQEFIL
jgi:hypothetical protein